jgi:hypothetical protein
MKRLAWMALLVACAGNLGGCVFAVGSTEKGEAKRIHRLEERMSAAERKLGIPEEAKQ